MGVVKHSAADSRFERKDSQYDEMYRSAASRAYSLGVAINLAVSGTLKNLQTGIGSPFEPSFAVKGNLSRRADWKLEEFAGRPERIAAKLRTDPEFKAVYSSFLTELISLGTGMVSIKDREKLHQNNQSAFDKKLDNQAEWLKNTACSSMLDALGSLENTTLSLSTRNVVQALDDVIADMRKRPESPVCWTVNGNNHSPTHEKLLVIPKTISQERQKLNLANSLQVRDIVVFSGNAAQITSYGPGPLGKIRQIDGELVGSLSEAEAIRSLLFAEAGLADSFEIIEEARSLNTGQNLMMTAAELKRRGIEDYSSLIALNSQSGLSGLRSALTVMGWQNNGHLPQKLHFINPDLSIEEALELPSYEFVGKTFLQSMREFTNMASYLSRKFFLPPMPLPKTLIASYKECLRKIGIEPDRVSANQVLATLNKMNAQAMSDGNKRLIGENTSYGEAIAAARTLSAQKRPLQDALARAREAAVRTPKLLSKPESS